MLVRFLKLIATFALAIFALRTLTFAATVPVTAMGEFPVHVDMQTAFSAGSTHDVLIGSAFVAILLLPCLVTWTLSTSKAHE